MKTAAIVCRQTGGSWELADLELDAPRAGEVLVRVSYAGLCYSDEHVRKGTEQRRPNVGGHEGAGIVEAVGAGVAEPAPGDHVVFSFVPACRQCFWCVNGQSYLCDLGANIGTGQMVDGTFRFHGDGLDYGGVACLGTFSERTVVSQYSCVRIDKDIPLDVAALVGCGVPTGWGSATNVAQVAPGDVVCVFGSGGIGINAVQGALMSGARSVIVIDPLQMKIDFALDMGAHHGFTEPDAALEFIREHTRGVMADKVIQCVNILDAATTRACFDATRKGGTLVLTGLADGMSEITVQLPGGILAMYSKRILGSLYGGCNPRNDIPKLLGLYRTGHLKLEELITHRYDLAGVGQGYQDLDEGKLIRGLVAINPE